MIVRKKHSTKKRYGIVVSKKHGMIEQGMT